MKKLFIILILPLLFGCSKEEDRTCENKVYDKWKDRIEDPDNTKEESEAFYWEYLEDAKQTCYPEEN